MSSPCRACVPWQAGLKVMGKPDEHTKGTPLPKMPPARAQGKEGTVTLSCTQVFLRNTEGQLAFVNALEVNLSHVTTLGETKLWVIIHTMWK